MRTRRSGSTPAHAKPSQVSGGRSQSSSLYPRAHTGAPSGRLPRTAPSRSCHSRCSITSSSKMIADSVVDGVSLKNVRSARMWLNQHATSDRALSSRDTAFVCARSSSTTFERRSMARMNPETSVSG